MKKLVLLSLALSLSMTFMSFAHKYYVSKTIIEHDLQSNSIEITAQIFVDDLESILLDIHDLKLYIGEENEDEKSEYIVEQYLRDNFKLILNGHEIRYHFLGFELDGETLYCYMDYLLLEDIATLDVNNSILLDFSPDQKNIVDAKFFGWNKRIILNRELQLEKII